MWPSYGWRFSQIWFWWGYTSVHLRISLPIDNCSLRHGEFGWFEPTHLSVLVFFFLFLFLHLFSVFAFSRPDMKMGVSRWIYPPTRFPRHSCCSEPVRFWGMAVRWICSSGEWFEWSSETGAAHVEGALEAWQVTKMNKSAPVLQVFFRKKSLDSIGTPMIHEFNGCS